MPDRLPPLSSLRAFEAVARRLSFSRAAEDLHVTPGAVSQQIRFLEQHLGAILFERTRRSVALTETAMKMLPEIQAGLETLARALSSKAAPHSAKALTISVAPSFASKWLLPRLADFSDLHPDIDLRISATVGLADFKRDKVDLAIRLGRGVYPELHTELLFGEALAPLCAPQLIEAKGPLRKPDDLRKHRLLHDTSIPGESEQSSWERWLSLAGAKHVPAHRGTRFSLADLAMQAAVDGAGVVLGRMVLAEGDLATGRLVRPFKVILPLDVSYFLVMPKGSARRSEVQIFRDWLYGAMKGSASGRQARKPA
jgi:LysR family transcriptional regulator, glycine cleavage system transcriptional activator